MKKYLLTLIGDFSDESACKNIAVSLTPLVDSKNMKFQYTRGVLLFHFGSEIQQSEIHDFIVGTLYGEGMTFILTEFTDKVSVSMYKENKEHLFDLENNTGDMKIKINMDDVYEFSDDESEEDYVALILEDLKKKVKKPTLDQLLEKIKLSGVNSLSIFEKETLESYSK